MKKHLWTKAQWNRIDVISPCFLQVTNQMVTACKNYITDYGMSRIWDQSYKTLIDKLQVSVKLYKEYQTCFHKAKKKIEAIPEERPFDFSEMYIFGKFDAFCKRIDKVRTALYRSRNLCFIPSQKKFM